MMTNHSYPPDKCTFELLSAYLDGEVTAQQREEVQDLLANDPEIQSLYRRLLYLRDEFQNLPTPQPEYSPQELSSTVFAKVDQENRRCKTYVWGGGAIAAVILATLGGILNGNRTLLLQMANRDSQLNSDENLVIALNEPVIALPANTEESLMIPLDQSLMDIIENK
ncbi:anti-sigma factor family protein [Cyanobacterium aponinum]|nr:hypothetical protein [Cyanobacterium aponinum]